MRTIAPVGAVLAIAVAGMMLSMSGFAGAWGAPPPSTDRAEEELRNGSADLAPSAGPVAGPVSSADSSIVGLLASGVGALVDVAGAVALLPVLLVELGFPAWFSYPLGFLAQLLAGVGIVQFATNRVWN